MIKNLGPAAAAVFVMWFMLQWLIRRLDAADVQRDAAHKELVGVLMTTIATNTEALSKSAGAMDRNTVVLQLQAAANRRSLTGEGC